MMESSPRSQFDDPPICNKLPHKILYLLNQKVGKRVKVSSFNLTLVNFISSFHFFTEWQNDKYIQQTK